MLKIFNLKQVSGPTSDEMAVRHCAATLANARVSRQKLVLIVHGYGSSGVGGSNKHAIQQFLMSEAGSGSIQRYVPGEQFSPGLLRDLQKRYPGHHFQQLEAHVRSRNPGVTLVFV